MEHSPHLQAYRLASEKNSPNFVQPDSLPFSQLASSWATWVRSTLFHLA